MNHSYIINPKFYYSVCFFNERRQLCSFTRDKFKSKAKARELAKQLALAWAKQVFVVEHVEYKESLYRSKIVSFCRETGEFVRL